MASKKCPEINASSMADISFLLLIFFLVATTMNVDSGIRRTLPPIVDEEQDKGQDVKERNVLLVYVNMYNQVAIAGNRVEIDEIKDIAKEFITNPTGDPNLPEFEAPKKPIPGFPNALVSKGVISLQNDRGTSYETYIQVQNELTRAYSEVRSEKSQTTFNKPYKDLSKEERDIVHMLVPTRISEAEPRNLAK